MAFWDNWFKTEETAKPVTLTEAAGANVAEDMTGWTRLSSDNSRDLGPVQRSRMQKVSAYLWQSNLIANRLVELPVAYLLAEGVKLTNEEPELQKVLDRFWKDPINDMENKLEKKVRELSLFGEQFYPAFVNEHTGHVRLGYLDPAKVQDVVFDPDNPEQPIGVITHRDSKGRYSRYRIIINGPEEVFTLRTQAIRQQFADGELFYFNINAFCNQGRGHGDLTAQADFLDLYDEFLFGEGERAQSLRAFVWDVTLTGADQGEVNRRAAEITPPGPNSVNVHNDRESWQPQSPQLNAGDTEVIGKLFKNHILAGATMSPHWFADGSDVNRANGESMGEPTLKILTLRQRKIRNMLITIATYALRQHSLAHNGSEPDLESYAYWSDVEFPELTAKDTSRFAAALAQVVGALVLVINEGLMTEDTALSIIASISGQLGVAFDAADELSNAKKAFDKKKKDEEKRDAFPGVDTTDDDEQDAA